MSKLHMNIVILLIPMLFMLSSNPAYAADFSDVQNESAHYLAITTLSTSGMISGYEDGTFKPKQKITRAEALKMIVLALYPEEKSTIENYIVPEIPSFSDTEASAWYTPYVEFAKDKKIINGYSDNTFRPDQTINLAETLKIFLNGKIDISLEEIAENLYKDTPQDSWFTSYTAYAGKYGIINIASSNEIFPEQDVTRGMLAEIIYRESLVKEGYGFGKATFYGSSTDGSNTSSGETFYSSLYTAAHKTLPFGTIVEVTNLENGKSVQVKINDRGPYGPGRVLDLSKAAFSAIGWLGDGVLNIQYKVIE